MTKNEARAQEETRKEEDGHGLSFLLFCHKDRWAGVSFMGLIVNPAHGHDRKGKERGKTIDCLVGQPSDQAVTKILTSSSKFSGSYVLTVQTKKETQRTDRMKSPGLVSIMEEENSCWADLSCVSSQQLSLSSF